MSDSQVPPWHHLPHSPRDFFGLPAGATRDQLKQAYSVLIRRFKPDKFPEEFKRIRAAFEQLDAAMRSGENQTKAPALEIPSVVIASTLQDNPHSELSPRAAAYQRIQENDPETWYRELTSRPHKTQYDYYVLASLSEVVESGSKGFADWIAEGLTQQSHSQDLSDLLQAYFKIAQLKPEEASALLLRLAQVLPGASYYAITDALWHRYSSMVPWETFQGVLESCERCLGIRIADDRKAFTVVLMRRVMWRAPLEWLHDKRKWVEESV
ncbi:MAG: J domain-containing protein, partial [Planctomycetota bacterium]